MLIELLATSNYASYNIKLAELLGLHSAIYLSELMNINDKAIRKNKLTDNYFNLKREYITSRTTLSAKEQRDIEANLLKLGILEKGTTQDDLSINVSVLTSIMMSSDESLIDDIKTMSKSPKATKEAKKQKIRDGLKLHIETTNDELFTAYCRWIDSVLEKDNVMTTSAVIYAQDTVDRYSNRDLDVALEIIKIASINGYRDMEWAIAKYEDKHKKVVNANHPKIKVIQSNDSSYEQKRSTKLSSEVF